VERWTRFLLFPISLLALTGLVLSVHGNEHRGGLSRASKRIGDTTLEHLLEVSLQAEKSSYTLQDTIVLRVLLSNKSSDHLYLYKQLLWGESNSFSIWARDWATEQDIPQDFTEDMPAPPPRSAADFVELLPEHIYGVIVKTSAKELNLKPKRKYELFAGYHSPVPSESGFGLRIISREQGSIRSNTVIVTVD
jgi:hypothetical protein